MRINPRRLLVLFFLLPFALYAQDSTNVHYLKGAPGKRFSLLRGSFFMMGLEARAYRYEAQQQDVRVRLYYTYVPITTGPSGDSVFYGAATVIGQPLHAEARMPLALEGQVRGGPTFLLRVAFSSQKGIFGKFNNLDFYEVGMRFNFGIFPRKRAPLFILTPGASFGCRELDYLLGHVYVPGTIIQLFNNRYEVRSDGSGLQVGYAAKYYMLHTALGVWWLPHPHRRTSATGVVLLPHFSVRLDVAYDYTLFDTHHVTLGRYTANYKNIARERIVVQPHVEELSKLSRFDGVTLGLTLLFRPY